MKIKFQPAKGTRDFYPQSMAFRNWLFGKMKDVSQKFGYQQYDGPVLEPLGLYAAKSGEELVKKQTYVLTDRGGEQLALRPEMTPTLARMVAQKQNELPKPIRWFAIGPRFRYEKPQKGRFREFYQWDVDLVGVDSPEADAEVLAIGAKFFESLELSPKEVCIKVNNRQLIENKLNLIEIPKEKIPQVFRAIDRKGKMEKNKWIEYLKEIGLKDLQIKDLEGILSDKDFSRESEELTAIFATLEDLGLADYFEYDPTIVRGLEYYTGTVFEAYDRDGELRSILGGGRYGNLVEVVGGAPMSGVGFASSDAILEETLRKYKKIPDISTTPTKILVTIFSEALLRQSIKVSSQLRDSNIPTELYLDPETKLEKQLKYADQKGIPYVAIIGPDEAAKDEVLVKNMKTGEQKKVPQDQILQILQMSNTTNI